MCDSAALCQLNTSTEFGHSLLRSGVFRFAAGYTNVNCGSYGCCPRPVAECRRRWQERCDGNPDAFFRFELQKAHRRSVEAIARDVNCPDSGCLAIVDDASSGVNAVLRSLRWSAGDSVLLLSTAYGMVRRTAEYLRDTLGVKIVSVDVRFPFDEEELVRDVEEMFSATNGIKLASFSHITSTPAVILPVKRLQRVCAQHGAMCLVDAAHAYGQIEIDLADMEPDFYVANGHKWAYVPRAAAFLYVRKSLRHLIHPTVISFGYGNGFQNEFRYVGTKDYSAWLTFPCAIAFRERLGAGRIRDYNHRLAVEAGHRVAAIWGTEVLNDEQCCGSMVDVRLPIDDAIAMERCADKLLLGTKTYVAWHRCQGRLYCRLSAQIFNELADYEVMARDVLSNIEMLQDERNEHLWQPHIGVKDSEG